MADSTTTADTHESGYRVLARKYRPATFDDLIGQEPMVQTLRNAFEIGRIAQAYILTGVRGVGKTTTARILARGLNFQTEAGDGAPTVDLPKLGDQMGIHCEAIMEGRHVDVIEMDAASHNGVGDIREITDAARYSPVSARFKVYLLDEVHMLSTAAFNALLKTLEEPPDHVKFIFATTEIGKVPVTILSRCQRFDLRRVEVPLMMAHLAKITEAEGASAEEDAIRLIARASEGSVRDGLSLLDQAIAHTGASEDTPITAESLHDLLNLADQAATLSLFEAVMKGDSEAALGQLAEAYGRGTDPAGLIADLAEIVHAATRAKVMPDHPSDALTGDNQARLSEMAKDLSVKVLSRTWQMLLKGLDELSRAPKPLIAAEMILVRLCYVADLPTPDEAIKALGEGAPSRTATSTPQPPSSSPSNGGGARASLALAPQSESPAPAPTQAPKAEAKPQPVALRDLDALIALAEKNGNRALPPLIRAYIRPVSFGDNQLEIGLAAGAPQAFVGDLAEALKSWTGARWMISVNSQADAQTLNELAAEREVAKKADASQHPTVQAILQAFPGATITGVRSINQEDADAAPVEDALEDTTDGPDIDDTRSDTDDEEDPPWTS
ncbi:MAG: DNA polymerase III subunit gamma/tau [Rhizobiales bacterium]|nr:DNA polymerase III subunit gamma/tau [Hyphomicrobiales bacterium]MBO6699240.1 DNA polymerase III subunit gamma/tau [Hyphomicrobiales bacterium]MBO6736778.1 DNA polymerase III subunit gamma/tau [Hyphomicrobiales bacterium]MBO6912148.1 DNA polymerase III subunit gamma/tau [Hyphomicrobiales bacterium]MBO6956982.1 DNA polymerase III subunit gamma/tau [Hyphomicrobiales bacterium]